MKIYAIDGSTLLDAPITSSAEHVQELSKSDYVKLSWVMTSKMVLPVGAYIIPFNDGLRYRLIEPYYPNQNNEIEWKFEPEFQHPLMWLSKIPFTYTTVDSTKQMSYTSQDWPYMGLTTSLLQVVVDQINNLFGFSDEDKFTYQIVGSVDTTLSVTFSSTDIISALSTIASACEDATVEWHLSWENKCLYFGQISFTQGEQIPTLKVGENIGKVSVSSSKNSYYNVYYPQGSTRNISIRLTNGHYLASSLRLGLNFPLYEDCKYKDGLIDTRTDKNEPAQVLAITFDEVYPHVTCYAYNVRCRTDILKEDGSSEPVRDQDGNPVQFSIWYMRLAYPLTTKEDGYIAVTDDIDYDDTGKQIIVKHYWYDYFVDSNEDIIDGYSLHGQFTANTNINALTQPLLGQPTSTEGFEMKCHQADTTIKLDDGSLVRKGDFEIIYQKTNDIIVPTTTSDGLYPRGEITPSLKGNCVILYNIRLTQNEIKSAQDDLLVRTQKEIKKRASDLNNYSFSSYPHIFSTKANPNLYIGKKVVFDDGCGYSLDTRVIKLTTKIDYNFIQQITVGNQKIKGTTSQLKEDVKTLMLANASGSAGLNDAQVKNIIRNYGASLFLSKNYDDSTEYMVTFGEMRSKSDATIDKNAIIKENASIGGNVSISGNSQLGTNGTSTNFGNYIADSTGATIKVEEDGTSYIEADYLSIRRAADFREITIRELRYIGGELAITPAAMQVCKVERLDADMNVLTDESAEATYFKCYFETTDANGKQKLYQEFVAGDQARCQQFGISQGTSEFVKTKYYWRLVSAVGEDYIVLSNKYGEKDAYTTSEPDVNDNIVQLGYQGAENLPNRQSAIILSATANDAPSQKYYEGIDDFSLDHVVKDEGYDKVSQSFHCNIYGNSYTGDKNHQSYFRYDAATQTASFSGTAHFDSASTKDGNEIATIPDLENLRTKSGNLLRNTSFCGSYESINVQGDTDITEGKETFSESVEYWSLTDCTIQDDAHSESGKSVLIEGTLSQVLEKPLTADGDYTLSFRGCGRKVVISVGGQTITQELQADYNRYEIHFACKDASELSFMITSEYATICEMMLTYGTLASEWSPAYADNDKSMAEFQSLKYLTDAITEGSTTIDGGLVMSQLIKVGNYRDRKMVQETGGMSGFYNDDDSAFLWGGGTMTQALYTIQTYKSDPTYQASDDEVANMAKFVVTHGGRAILNDIILRGYIYAEGGILKSVKSPNGSFAIDDSGDASFTSGTIGDFTLKNGYLTSTATDGSATYTMSLQKDYLNFTGTDERYATIGRFTNEGMKLMLKLIDDCPRTVETSYVATIAARGSKAQNVAIHFGGGCIEGVNYRNQVIGYNTYSSSTIPTLQETLGREVGCVVATTICYKSASGSVTTMYHDVEITMPSVYWYDDGHSILFKRFEGANNKITLKAGTFTELTNAETGATTTYNTCFISDRGTFSTELQLESVMDSFDLRFFRGLSAWIGTNKYVGVWVQFKHPRDW